MAREVIVKNGKDSVALLYHIDTSRPPVWIEGFEYKFNSKLVQIKRKPLDGATEYINSGR